MKTGIFGIFLLGLAAAQPHRRHQELHQKRDIVTQTTFVTATAAEVVVYVDANGNPVRTEGGGNQTPPTPAPAPPAPAPPAPAPPAIPAPPAPPAQAPPVSPPVDEAPAPAPAAPAPPAAEPPAPAPPAPAPPAPSVGLESGFIGQPPSGGPSDTPEGFGISYSPYTRDAATNAPRCKTTDEINEDFDTIKSGGYAFARIYGVDCDQTEDVLNAAVSRGMKVMTGIYHVQDAGNEVKKIIDALSASNADWKDIVTVGVGNEDVQTGRASVPEVLGALDTARSALRSNGYNGPVVHVDTVDATLNNPELCTASDYAAVNCHAFFDPNTPADQAGDFVQAQAQRVKNACNGANVSVMESGWPHAGETNGKAIPSPENQKIAVESLKNSFKDKMMVLFSAFDDKWKEDRADTFGAERNWGMWGVGH